MWDAELEVATDVTEIGTWKMGHNEPLSSLPSRLDHSVSFVAGAEAKNCSKDENTLSLSFS